MPDLTESLQGHDLGHLRIVAEFWGIELEAPDARNALPLLVKAMQDPQLVTEVTSDLPSEVRSALQELKQQAGRMPWALFTRRYGEVREMGAGKRDREQPYLNPVSAAEVLWYYGMIARAFFDTAEDVEEFAYIPDDLLTNLPLEGAQDQAIYGRAAHASERSLPTPVSDRILDHACTMLAALRSGLPVADEFYFPAPASSLTRAALQSLLISAGILDESWLPIPEATRRFLEAGRGEAMAMLTNAWLESENFNELRLIPGLSAEGSWKNEPLQTRQDLLRFFQCIPAGQWWNLDSYITAIKQQEPDFQRRGGDYDTWFLRSLESGEFLRGFEHWEDVEGELLRFFISGPLYWLGIVELAAMKAGERVTAFRRSAWAEALLAGEAPQDLAVEEAKLIVRSDAHLHAPLLAPRAVRYQVTRFCEWEKEMQDGYDYCLTPASLARAKKQGLGIQHLLGLLRKSAEAVPPSLVKALERWETHGSAARLERLSVLRFNSPEVLQALRSSRAARFLGEPLGPAAIAIKAGAEQKVLAILAELGYLGESKLEL